MGVDPAATPMIVASALTLHGQRLCSLQIMALGRRERYGIHTTATNANADTKRTRSKPRHDQETRTKASYSPAHGFLWARRTIDHPVTLCRLKLFLRRQGDIDSSFWPYGLMPPFREWNIGKSSGQGIVQLPSKALPISSSPSCLSPASLPTGQLNMRDRTHLETQNPSKGILIFARSSREGHLGIPMWIPIPIYIPCSQPSPLHHIGHARMTPTLSLDAAPSRSFAPRARRALQASC